MLKELAFGQESELSSHCKGLVFFRLRANKTHNPLSEAFHHGRLQYCVSDIPHPENR
jgi:hypothetical protein